MKGANLLACAVASTILQYKLIGELEAAVGSDYKSKISIACYVLAIGLAFVNQWFSGALYVLVALIWFIPDRRIESKINKSE